jgi:hypothetical protein
VRGLIAKWRAVKERDLVQLGPLIVCSGQAPGGAYVERYADLER